MSLRYYQREAVDAMHETVNNDVVVLPTGSGKSHVIRSFVEEEPGQILILSHVKEILEQDFNLLQGLPDIGLYSAGLGVKHIDRVTVAGIQSVWKRPELFRGVKKVLIDECHLVNDEGMYKSLIDALGAQYIGLTATPFRLKTGYIYGQNGMFHKVCYEASVKKLTEEGYLCPLEYFGDKEEYDTSDIKITGGDFNINAMSIAFNRDFITAKIVKQIAQYDKQHNLIFCIDIDHAEQVAQEMRTQGVACEAVHSNSPRDEAIQAFKNGEIPALANVNILTTGFDYPKIDMISILRPTKSMSLHQQMLGRGTRIHESKSSVLVKDFAGNAGRLGTLEEPAPVLNKEKRGKGGNNPYMKTCPECDLIQHPSVRVCKCGHKFKFRHNLKDTAFKPAVKKWYEIDRIFYGVHTKRGAPDSVKVSYVSGARVFNEWILIEHPGYAGHKARHWVSRRYHGSESIKTALDLVRVGHDLNEPSHIEVEEGGRYPKITQMRFATHE
jgi:DNA repair protein RadD